MSRVLILVILSIVNWSNDDFYVAKDEDLVRNLFLNLPIEKEVKELIIEANENRELKPINCYGEAYCYEFKRHPYLKLQNNYNYLVIEEPDPEGEENIKLLVEIGDYKDNRKLFVREYRRLKRKLNKVLEKRGKKKYIRFGSMGEIHEYRWKHKKGELEIHLEWRKSTCKFGESIIVKYVDRNSSKQNQVSLERK